MSTSIDVDSITEAYEDVRNDVSDVQWYNKNLLYLLILIMFFFVGRYLNLMARK